MRACLTSLYDERLFVERRFEPFSLPLTESDLKPSYD
jgi:hypothetical protein